MLASLIQQGIEVPSKEMRADPNKRKVKYGVRDRKKKKDQANGER